VSGDLYVTLGVQRGASQDEIKRAYRQKARELHPDAGGDAEQFKAVAHAYRVLSDPDSRQRYDRFGDDSSSAGDPFGFGDFGSLADILGSLFGGGAFTTSSRSRVERPGRDVLAPVDLDLVDVAVGVTRDVEVEVAWTCQTCGGSGSADGAAPVRCGACGGSGQVQRVTRTPFGQIATATPCATCAGSGRSVAVPCASCRGDGRTRQRRSVTVEIPAGVEDGDRIRVSGEGEAGRQNATAGDLYVELRVRRHPTFERDGRELWTEVRVPFVHAALGAALSVPVLDGTVAAVDLPPGTQHGAVLTIKKQGLPQRGGGYPGNLNVRVAIEVPRDLDADQADLLRRYAALRGEEAVPPAGGGLFSRIRDAFR